ncbi:MAG: trehalose 6-phosphate synthase [Candidatus Aceula meridiana]|nr:trehalose 6-phosphate synthase [Candidatus Aceula meridiana]
METLKTFYDLMFQTRDARRLLVLDCLENKTLEHKDILPLKQALATLEATPKKENQYILKLEGEKTIALDLSYEIDELKKDLLFLEKGEDALLKFLENIHADFETQIKSVVSALSAKKFHTLITDRDGTVNNYCGRYASSIQSVYNAVFLTRFAKKLDNAVILTSAPLRSIGLVDISVVPQGAFIHAASKGREYINKKNKRCHFPIKEEKQKKLDEFNAELSSLVKNPQYAKFALIGSGLQFKFGQTTIARQDITKSIPKDESLRFLKLVENLVSRIGNQKQFFRIEDTGKDVEIILTVENVQSGLDPKDFDKGDGVAFLEKHASLHMAKGGNLICGDTPSDIPMIPAALHYSNDTTAIFVSNGNEEFEQKVKRLYPNTIVVSTPDILVTALNALARD